MRIEHHLNKINKFQNTMNKLDLLEDSETYIEDCMLICAHLVNASLHKLKVIPVDKDIKHNQLFSFLHNGSAFGDNTEIVADSIQQIENLRPSYVYGKGENGDASKKAKEMFEKIKKICEGIIENGTTKKSD